MSPFVQKGVCFCNVCKVILNELKYNVLFLLYSFLNQNYLYIAVCTDW